MTEASAPPPSPPRALALASFALPCLLAIACAGNGMGFYDSPELASAGAGLGVTHPPGHPLWVALAAAAVTLVPVGAAPFRIALTCALCLGGLGRLALSAAYALARAIGDAKVSARVTAAAAFAASLTATLGVGVFRQTTRVEVYALAGLLAIAPLAFATARAPLAERARWCALLFGLGAANHHFIALTAFPLVACVLYARVREARDRDHAFPWRALLAWSALFALGLCAYLLLPLRADAPASLERVRSLGDFLDVASARMFAKNTGGGVPGGASGRVLDVLDWLGETLTPVGLLLAVGGFYLAARTRSARPQVVPLALLVLVVSLARAWLGFTRNNPDAAGYLLPAVVALGIASAGFTAGAARAIAEAPAAPRGPSPAARVLLRTLLVGGPLALPLYLATASVRASAIDRTYAPEVITSATLDALPPRTRLFAYEPNTIFRLRYAQLVEGERPDAVVVPAAMLGYPGMVSTLLARDRALTPVITQYLLRPDQGLSPRLLSSLAAERTAALELDPRNARDDVATLIPRGPVAELTAEPTTLAAVRGASAAHFARMDQLSALLAREPAASPLVSEWLLWREYTDALFFAARGARAEARRSVARGLEVDPAARELEALREALAQPGEGPVDIAPFTTGAAR